MNADIRRVEVDIVPGLFRAERVLSRAEERKNSQGRHLGRAFLLAEVVAVHVYGCPAAAYSYRRVGPCSCGAYDLFEAWAGLNASDNEGASR